MTLVDTDITCFRGDTFIYNFNDIDLTDYRKVYFTVKRNYQQTDAESTIQVDNERGLLYYNGAASASPTYARINITSASTATLTLEAPVTAGLLYYSTNRPRYYYDFQVVYTSGVVTTLQCGEFTLTRDVTRYTSPLTVTSYSLNVNNSTQGST